METTHASAIYLKLMKDRRDKLRTQLKRWANKIDEANQELEQLTSILEPKDDPKGTSKR